MRCLSSFLHSLFRLSWQARYSREVTSCTTRNRQQERTALARVRRRTGHSLQDHATHSDVPLHHFAQILWQEAQRIQQSTSGEFQVQVEYTTSKCKEKPILARTTAAPMDASPRRSLSQRVMTSQFGL